MRILIFLLVAMAANIALWIAILLREPSRFDLTSSATYYAFAGIGLSAAAMVFYGRIWWRSWTMTPGPGGTGPGTPVKPSYMGGITLVGILAAAALLLPGVIGREIEPMSAALILLLGGGTLFIIVAAAEQLAAGSEVEVSSHWGGLGGSLGGWRISQTAILLLLALILVSASVVASRGLDDVGVNNSSDSNSTQTADEDTAGNAADTESNEAGEAANISADQTANVSVNETAENSAEGAG